jgi:hypothetical protein
MRRRTIHSHDVALVTQVRDALKEYVCSTLGYDASLVSLDEEVDTEVRDLAGVLVETADVGFGIDAGDRLISIAITTPAPRSSRSCQSVASDIARPLPPSARRFSPNAPGSTLAGWPMLNFTHQPPMTLTWCRASERGSKSISALRLAPISPDLMRKSGAMSTPGRRRPISSSRLAGGSSGSRSSRRSRSICLPATDCDHGNRCSRWISSSV